MPGEPADGMVSAAPRAPRSASRLQKRRNISVEVAQDPRPEGSALGSVKGGWTKATRSPAAGLIGVRGISPRPPEPPPHRNLRFSVRGVRSRAHGSASRRPAEPVTMR